MSLVSHSPTIMQPLSAPPPRVSFSQSVVQPSHEPSAQSEPPGSDARRSAREWLLRQVQSQSYRNLDPNPNPNPKPNPNSNQ